MPYSTPKFDCLFFYTPCIWPKIACDLINLFQQSCSSINRSVNLEKLLQSDVLGFEDYQMNLEICRHEYEYL